MPLRHYKATHTRIDDNDQPIQHDVVTLSGYTAKEVKHIAVRRFGLQSWEHWTCTAGGTFQRVHIRTDQRPYRGIMTLEPIKPERCRK